MNMSVEEDNNYVSVGDNESRKNYYKAILMWVVILVGLVVALALLGNLSGLQKQFSTWTHKV
jgi:uncharacterized membrane protein YhaH (DUF805 family)